MSGKGLRNTFFDLRMPPISER